MDLPRSDLLDRLAAFMPKMADANAGLATAPVNVDGSLEVDEGDDGEAASSDGSSGSESGSESGDESGSAEAEAANAATKAAAATAAAPGTVEMKFQIGAVDPELMRLLQDVASADAAAAAAAAQPPPPPAALVMPWQAGADAGAAGATRLAEKTPAAPMIEEL